MPHPDELKARIEAHLPGSEAVVHDFNAGTGDHFEAKVGAPQFRGLPLLQQRPMCGFSMRVVQALRDVDADFAAMDILPDPRIRQVLSSRSGWPTIPQLYVDGELVGGCDITMELHESGELAQIVKAPA